jgi:hypothetical protein
MRHDPTQNLVKARLLRLGQARAKSLSRASRETPTAVWRAERLMRFLELRKERGATMRQLIKALSEDARRPESDPLSRDTIERALKLTNAVAVVGPRGRKRWYAPAHAQPSWDPPENWSETLNSP